MKEHQVFKEFKELSKVPRPSSHEEKVVEYLYNWALDNNIYVIKDDYRNVFMKKPASTGYESYSPICLQAHTDMVCEAADGFEHDFFNDPIEMFVDGDIVSTHGQTTLGADNGLGISAILAILKDDNLKHPEIEAVFTSGEEEDFYGADNFDINNIKANYLLNLDNSDDNKITCGSAGGVTVKAMKELDYIELSKEDYISYRVKISGLTGGHSGGDIHRGRGNSNIILFRLLDKFRELDYYLLDINGGTFRLAIPRESSVDIVINKSNINLFEKIADEFLSNIIEEFPGYADKLKLELLRIEEDRYKAINKSISESMINYVLLSPVDIQMMSNSFQGLVDASCNLGEIYIKDSNLIIISDIRASYDSQREFVLRKLILLSDILNFEKKVYGYYYNWKYNPHSKLRNLAKEIYSKNNSKEPIITTVHAGLEGGFFSNKKPNIDIISIGATSWNFHSPNESFSLSSLERFYNNLVEILEFAKFDK